MTGDKEALGGNTGLAKVAVQGSAHDPGKIAL